MTARDIAPHHGEHHEKRDKRGNPVASQPDDGQDDKGGHWGGLDDTQNRAQKGVGQGHKAGQHRQQAAADHCQRESAGHPQQGGGRCAIELPRPHELNDALENIKRRYDEYLLFNEAIQPLPKSQPKERDGADAQYAAPGAPSRRLVTVCRRNPHWGCFLPLIWDWRQTAPHRAC